MERIALISVIHGNVPALEAVLNDSKKRNISKYFVWETWSVRGRIPKSL